MAVIRKLPLAAVTLALGLAWGGLSAQAQGVTEETAPAVSAQLLQRGIDALNASQTDEAMDLLEQAIVAHPKNARAFAYLGQAHEKAGDMDKARKNYEAALSIDPDDLKALMWAGLAAIEKEELEAAQTHLERLRRLCSGRCAEFRTLSEALSESKT